MKVPFRADGSLLRDRHAIPESNRIEKDNFEFFTTLHVLAFRPTNNSFYVELIDPNGVYYYMSARTFKKLFIKNKFQGAEITGTFTFECAGGKFGIILCEP